MSEARTKEQIKRDVKVLLLEDSYIKQLVQDYRDTLEPDIDNLAKARAKMFKDMFTELKQRSPEHYAEYKTDLMESNSTKTEYWQKFYKAKLVICNGILKGFIAGEKLEEKEAYVKLVDFVTSNEAPDFYQESKELKKARNTADTIIKQNDGAINFYDELLEILLVRYLQTAAGIDSDTAVKLLQTSKEILSNGRETALITEEAADVIKLEIKNLLDDTPEELKPYVYALKDIKNNVYILYDAQEELNTKQAEEKETGKEQREIIPRYFRNEEMLISHSEYITTLVKNGFMYNESVFNKSEEVLNSLKSEDNDILDLLILNWYEKGIRRFTDRQIATALYKKGDSNANVTAAELKKINESIDRLRKTDIKQGIESIEKIDSSKLKITETTTLISVIVREFEHTGSTTVYDFTGVQGYYQYAQATDKISKYKNALISADIIGLQHDFKNDTLRRLLTRRVTGLEYSKNTAVDMREIYEILEITDRRKYTDARKKTEKILKELRNKNNDVYYNFGYEFKRQGKTTTRLVLKRDNTNPLKVDKTAEEQ